MKNILRKKAFTIKEVQQLQASVQLDELIARLVFGEPKPKPSDPLYTTLAEDHPMCSEGGNWYRLFDFKSDKKHEWCPMPFSTNLQFAWNVVEALKDRFALHHMHGTNCGFSLDWRESVKKWTVVTEHSYDGPWHWVEADTPQLAICKAAVWRLAGKGKADW